jgi:hypothetical protein
MTLETKTLYALLALVLIMLFFVPAAHSQNFISVMNPSKTGPQEESILRALDLIQARADSKCITAFPNLKDAVSMLEGSRTADTLLIGHGEFKGLITAAFTGSNPKYTDIPDGYSIVVNDAGAFFVGKIDTFHTMYTAGMTGGTNEAKVIVLMHEIGHFLQQINLPSPVVPDLNQPALVEQNNETVKHNCGDLLKAAHKLPQGAL